MSATFQPGCWAVGFTGHRPDVLGGYDKDAPKNVVVRDFLGKVVRRLALQGFEYFVCGGALGVDQWAADAVLEYAKEKTEEDWFDEFPKPKLVMALPFKDYGEKWPESSRAELARQCAASHLVHVVCEGPYATYKNHLRNHWMVDNSMMTCAVWNGSGDGGTANCVRYALSKGKTILRFNPETEAEEPVVEVPKRSKK